MGPVWLEAAVGAWCDAVGSPGEGQPGGKGQLVPSSPAPPLQIVPWATPWPPPPACSNAGAKQGCEAWQGCPTEVVSRGKSLGRVINGLQENNIY